MYYHIIIETNDKKKNSSFHKIYDYDYSDIEEVKEEIIKPYLSKTNFFVSGSLLNVETIRSIKVKKTAMNAAETFNMALNDNIPGVISLKTKESVIAGDKYSDDITRELFKEMKTNTNISTNNAISNTLNNKVFIVHGHDNSVKNEMARYIEKLDLKPVILHEQASSNKTIIEKIEANNDVGFAVVLYTACDVGAKKEEKLDLQPRARQNVIFEHGYFIGHLGRDKVCALLDNNIEAPNDISGVVYITLDERGAWKMDLAKELKAAGFTINFEAIFK